MEAFSWDVQQEDKVALMQLYVPYLILGKHLSHHRQPQSRGLLAMVQRGQEKTYANVPGDTATGMGLDMFYRLSLRLKSERPESRSKAD